MTNESKSSEGSEIQMFTCPVILFVERVLGFSGKSDIKKYENVSGYRNHAGFLEIYQWDGEDRALKTTLIPQLVVATVEVFYPVRLPEKGEKGE